MANTGLAFMVQETPPDICPEFTVLHTLQRREFHFKKDKGSLERGNRHVWRALCWATIQIQIHSLFIG